VTPQTSDERIQKMDALSDGFIYVVSTNTITGGQVDFETGQRDYFQHIQSLKLKNPALVGFGIRDKHTFGIACKYLNGAIIGTAFIKSVENATDIQKTVRQFINSIQS
jgi:tryptophan synthase alpha chain